MLVLKRVKKILKTVDLPMIGFEPSTNWTTTTSSMLDIKNFRHYLSVTVSEKQTIDTLKEINKVSKWYLAEFFKRFNLF